MNKAAYLIILPCVLLASCRPFEGLRDPAAPTAWQIATVAPTATVAPATATPQCQATRQAATVGRVYVRAKATTDSAAVGSVTGDILVGNKLPGTPNCPGGWYVTAGKWGCRFVCADFVKLKGK